MLTPLVRDQGLGITCFGYEWGSPPCGVALGACLELWGRLARGIQGCGRGGWGWGVRPVRRVHSGCQFSRHGFRWQLTAVGARPEVLAWAWQVALPSVGGW